MDYGEIFSLIKESIRLYCGAQKTISVLEVGCGPGFMSLELARSGFNVTGIDLSNECISIARRFADKDPHIAERGKLEYLAGDFFSHQQLIKGFDAIVFVGALHHFPDQDAIIGRCKDLLASDGIIIVHEPTRDRVQKKNAAIYLLVKSLLFKAGGYYEAVNSYTSTRQIDNDVEAVFKKMRYEDDHGDKLQSVNDNSAGYTAMLGVLTANF